MKLLTFWFDPISPYAYLAFERLPQVLEGVSYAVRYRPVLFAGLLGHWGQKGPAEIEPKRAWTFRQVHWLAHRDGIALDTPAVHPFNPLAHLRLLLACAPPGGTPNRRVCEAVLRHVWIGAHAADDAARWAELVARLAPPVAPDDAALKQALRDATQAALERGIFGVPTIEVDGLLFWGVDALPMLRSYLDGDPWFATDAWAREGAPRRGLRR
jgi:2-hydroxychromene-2-carboxylate isomerase